MPIYEYECQKCEKVHELMQKFSDPPMDQCPDCGAPVEKLMSQSSFALKGTGWYTTDYKRAGKKESSAETKKETKESESKSEGSTEKKDKKPKSNPES